MATEETWKLKTDPETNAPIVQDGKIVYIDPKGDEVALHAPDLHSKITDLNKENKSHREKAKGLQTKLDIFKDIEDIGEWKINADKAIESVNNFKDEDWMKAEKVEKLKKSIADSYEEKISNFEKGFKERETEHLTTLDKKDFQIRKLLISNEFSKSPHFTGENKKTTLPPQIAESYFGKHFKVKEDNDGNLSIAAHDNLNDAILSKANPGTPAEFEEAISIILDSFPGKEEILVASSSGSGGQGGQGGGQTTDSLTKLQQQYAEAQKNGNTKLMISLKRQIHEAQAKG